MPVLLITLYTLVALITGYTASLGITRYNIHREAADTHVAITAAMEEFVGANCQHLAGIAVSYRPGACLSPIDHGNLACKTAAQTGHLPSHGINLYSAVLSLAHRSGRSALITLKNPTSDPRTRRLFNTLSNRHAWLAVAPDTIIYSLDSTSPDTGEGEQDLLLVAAGLDNNCNRTGAALPSAGDNYEINCDRNGTKPWNGSNLTLTGTKTDGVLNTLDLIQSDRPTRYRGWRANGYGNNSHTHILTANPDPCNA